MSGPERPPVDPALRARKLRDGTVLLPLLGTVLLLPPAVRVSAVDASVFGVPLAVLYVFAVWAGLIVAARILARLLRDEAGPPGPGA